MCRGWQYRGVPWTDASFIGLVDDFLVCDDSVETEEERVRIGDRCELKNGASVVIFFLAVTVDGIRDNFVEFFEE